MATWCLVRFEADRFRKALKDGSISPEKLGAMTSAERNAYLSKFVSPENATNINALFESKLLLNNQKAGMISWAKKVVGITPTAKRDMLYKIERLDCVLDPKEGEQFLHDLASTRLGIDITQEEAKQIADLSKAVSDSEKLANKEGIFPTEKDRLAYGTNKVAIEKYINDLKLESGKISFKQEPFRKIAKFVKDLPGVTKSLVASLDNSFWGRQGIKTLLDVRTSKIWGRNFLKSWSDIGKEIVGVDAMDAIKADVYSRPNALNGKYSAGRYGLDVLTEEAYPSSLPERIPLFGRLFKASESAYNGGALRMRADLADRLIKIAEKQGINTLNKDQAMGMGHLVGSLTGRGSLELTKGQAETLNEVFFSVKFLKSNIDTLTAHVFDKQATPFVRKEAGKALLSILASLATILTVAKIIDPDSVEEDPRSSNFGKIKVFGRWTDITGGMRGLVTLASQLVPTYHNGELGFWSKKTNGDYVNMTGLVYGQQTPLDIFESFFEGKLSPTAGVIRDIWARKTYQGTPVTVAGEVGNVVTPLLLQNITQLKSPDSAFPLGSMMLDALGFSVGTSVNPNIKSGLIPEGSKVKNQDLIGTVLMYAKAVGVDPETAFNRLFSGQRITRVDNGTIIVERMPVGESQEVKKKLGGNNPTMKLDHTIPLELGGSNDESNLKLVTTSQWSSYTSVENALGKALKDKKIDKATAQKLITDFKGGRITKEQVLSKLK